MRNRKPRRYRHRSNGRNHHQRQNGIEQTRLNHSMFSNANGRPRNQFVSQQNAVKLAERYNTLAKEALSSGDKILSENYLQHADHFTRIIEVASTNQIPSKSQESSEPKTADKKSSDSKEDTQNKTTSEEKNKNL